MAKRSRCCSSRSRQRRHALELDDCRRRPQLPARLRRGTAPRWRDGYKPLSTRALRKTAMDAERRLQTQAWQLAQIVPDDARALIGSAK